jgi:orotate phosphoribosyltransferase-like protein
MTSEMKQLDWRRSKVLELSSQGYSEREISETIKVSDTTVHRDLVHLREQAQENLQKHIHQTIPQEHQQSLTGINQVLKMAWGIATQDIDNKTKLQALALINDCNKYKMDLATGSGICKEAINFVTQRKEQLNKLETLQKVEERTEEMEEEEADKTTSGTF